MKDLKRSGLPEKLINKVSQDQKQKVINLLLLKNPNHPKKRIKSQLQRVIKKMY